MCARQRVCIVTGTRAEFGLLTTVMDAVEAHEALDLQVLVTGTHLLEPQPTIQEIRSRYHVDAQVVMQQPGHSTRADDAVALGRGVEGCAHSFAKLQPDWVVVLGDRIEALAASSAASVMGMALGHIHGGDRAPGIADEAMRHAITRLAHLHLPATEQSAARIERMGEEPWRIHAVGSPAIDALGSIAPLDDEAFDALGEPEIVVLMHPTGRDPEAEHADMARVLDAMGQSRTLVLDPNHDAGRNGIVGAIESRRDNTLMTRATHLPRAAFVGLLKRLASGQGVLVGNSSAALIEASALRLPAVDIGPRQLGRERPENVTHIDTPTPDAIAAAVARARQCQRDALTHPYGSGEAGRRIANILATALKERSRNEFLRKCLTY